MQYSVFTYRNILEHNTYTQNTVRTNNFWQALHIDIVYVIYYLDSER